RRRLFEFGVIGGLEVFPARRIAMETAAQGVARRDFSQPQIDLRPLPREAARPQPIHQDANAVCGIRWFIDPFDAEWLPGHFVPETTIKVDVPWASTRRSCDVTRALVEMIWRVCD